MNRVVFVDLDDTLFQTRRKNRSASRVAAVDSDGKPFSFQSGKQVAMLEWLLGDGAVVVPVTGRSVKAFRRVDLPFSGPAICAFGGVILLENGTPDPVWNQKITAQADHTGPLVTTMRGKAETLATQMALNVRCAVVAEYGRRLYLSVKDNDKGQRGVACLGPALQSVLPSGWALHLNGANMALLPPFLRKERAVLHLLATAFQPGECLTIGMGDSLSDQGFLQRCDFAIIPQQAQLMALLRGMAAGAGFQGP